MRDLGMVGHDHGIFGQGGKRFGVIHPPALISPKHIHDAGLETWNRPTSACLSSRIPYGTAVTKENVRTVEMGEEAIRALGFSQFRVRFHEKLVRVEIDPAELPLALNLGMAQDLVKIFKPLSFHYVTLDLEGYRQGSGNEVLRDN